MHLRLGALPPALLRVAHDKFDGIGQFGEFGFGRDVRVGDDAGDRFALSRLFEKRGHDHIGAAVLCLLQTDLLDGEDVSGSRFFAACYDDIDLAVDQTAERAFQLAIFRDHILFDGLRDIVFFELRERDFFSAAQDAVRQTGTDCRKD